MSVTITDKLQKIFAGNSSNNKNPMVDDSGYRSSGHELVFGGGAALCGRVSVRLVSNDHFWWNA